MSKSRGILLGILGVLVVFYLIGSRRQETASAPSTTTAASSAAASWHQIAEWSGSGIKMSLRWSDEEFLALDNKRHRERTTFQKIGEMLFLGWLQGTLYTEGQKLSAAENQQNIFGIILENLSETMPTRDRVRSVSDLFEGFPPDFFGIP